ncbi:MAG: heme ABC exporter ATP-binding protein CcmA [Acidimicrobiales bacterium]
MEPAVHLRGAVSLLGRFPALAGVDLDVGPGQVVLLRGPNGAGKTTLLRCCAGLVAVTAGTAEVLGHDLVGASRARRRSLRRRVGLLGHATGLYDDLSVADNVRFWARAGGADAADAEAAMIRLGLDGRLRHLAVGRLSAGQRRRTSLAVMLARRPALWLLDEPHAGLDQAGRDIVDGLIAEARAAGVTVLIASHELDRAEAVATRTVTMVGGTVIGDDRPPTLAGAAEEGEVDRVP